MSPAALNLEHYCSTFHTNFTHNAGKFRSRRNWLLIGLENNIPERKSASAAAFVRIDFGYQEAIVAANFHFPAFVIVQGANSQAKGSIIGMIFWADFSVAPWGLAFAKRNGDVLCFAVTPDSEHGIAAGMLVRNGSQKRCGIFYILSVNSQNDITVLDPGLRSWFFVQNTAYKRPPGFRKAQEPWLQCCHQHPGW